ncbi:MAG: polyphenol oxidase family protein [Acidipropionibacterium acidipropionici]|jgi:YfiH family protein|uniref:Membrane protein YfiH n=1 Tax=Acidipropionibacterium acidipropionici (strain ATCC 4875 / DSM 20272 / JCM 6432 / NBRC 12425 / NCIMB 8070 / 4) TaxID=1171373 RepID=K7RRX0_ACIA4|nr:polyphenol oxidase family protein [Acidipropionibacterium acidipropionici]AFV89111.1 Membrane protein YfiH [Acidipropionibacterium acidipropionici ATCC 4875]ALN16317.1 multicopper polyphenol oxidase [Acidipropionibacterium acidipropionici]APZ07935.1 multicopper polyphenol oxidase [Acidipropionibacterium acidipropionici]
MLRMRIDPGANHGVGVAFTDRRGGDSPGALGGFNLGRVDADDPARLVAHLGSLREALGVQAIALVHQVHGTRVVRFGPREARLIRDDDVLREAVGSPDPLPSADAMVTSVPGVALGIRVADCLPVMLADPAAGVVGAAHAGRAGLLGGVLGRTVEEMRGAGAGQILGWIGPHICGRCYEVPTEMAEQVWQDHPATRSTTSWGTPALDLAAEALAQLEGLGVDAVGLDPCTLENEDLFSHRRDPGSGRMAGLVWIAGEQPRR